MKISIIYIYIMTNAQCSFPNSMSKRQTTSLQRLRTTHLCCDISKEKSRSPAHFSAKQVVSPAESVFTSPKFTDTQCLESTVKILRRFFGVLDLICMITQAVYIYEKHWQGEKIVYMYAKEIAYNSRILNHTYNDYMNRCFLKNAVDCGCPHIQRNNATVDGGCPQDNIN